MRARSRTLTAHPPPNAERWAFPTSKCNAAEAADSANAELCARRDADIDSWAFLVTNVTGE